MALVPLLLVLVSVGLAGQATSAGGTQRLRYANQPWALFIDLPGFVQDEEWASRNGTRRMFRVHHPETNVIVSAFLERNPEFGSKEQCRDHYWAKLLRSPIEHADVSFPQRGAMAMVRALVPQVEGRPVRQQNVHAHLFRDGVCIEIHLSKVLYEPDDERLFDAVLRTVRFGAAR